MSIFGNIIWFIFGGFILFLGWFAAGLFCCLTIIGIPFGIQCFKFAQLALAPFGKRIDYGTPGMVSVLANLIWIAVFGWGLAVASIIIGVLYSITIIGIPFGLQSFKFAKLAIFPFGAKITS